jgi:thiamine transporter
MRDRLRDLTIIGTGAALSIVLGLACKALPLPRLPYGGSITLESIPILYVALWRGWRPGLQTGLLCGFLQLLLDAHIYHPAQVLLDYPIAFGLLGFAPFAGYAIPGIFLGCALRFCAHFTSGIIFFAAYAPEGTSAWLYSATYNASYLIPDAILASVLVPILLRRTGKEKPAVAAETAGS